ncbi:MAG: WecB/TagA/CpsF family glycosyltransferase [bacterium]
MQENLNISHLNPKKILFYFENVKDYIDQAIKQNRKEMIVTLNTEMFIDSMEDLEFKKIIDNSVVVLESVGICLLYSKKMGIKVEPVNGIDIAQEIVKSGYRVFILGTKESIVRRAVENLRKLYENCNIVGYNDGYFADEERVIEEINLSSPEVLLVGMGSPKQEKWIYKNIDRLNFNVAIGIGGSIDVWAGVYKRAPFVLRKMKLEWMYRILSDIRRIPRFIKILKFIILMFTRRI